MSQRSMGENRSSGEEPTEGLPAEAPPPLSAVEAYEKEIRDRLSSGPTEPGAPGRRRWVGAAAVVAALAVAGGVTYAVREGAREERRREDARRYVEAAKNGLARDTRASYAASAEALRASLALDPSNEEAKALLALALAHLAIDYGTGDSDRARAEELARAEGATHSPALEARRILARAEGTGVEEAEAAILERAETDFSAAIQSLAGEILLARGDAEKAIERFNAALKEMPGHVPTLVRIGDYYRARKEYGEALRYYDLAVAVAEDHAAALLGAAESQLALRAEPAQLRASLADLARLRDEAMVPVRLRERRILVEAELHLALGDRAAARARLEALPLDVPSPELAVPMVRAFLRAGAPDRAAARFAAFSPTADAHPELREAWVRILLARHDFLRATSVLAASGERELAVLQGIAWFELEEYHRARQRLTSARRAGKLPVEAIVYLAWIDWREGRRASALPTLERFGTGARARTSGALAYAEALWARGEADRAQGVLERAIERDPHAASLHFAAGLLARRQLRFEEAIEKLEAALERNPYHVRARAALGALHLERGDVEAAAAHFARLREQRPESGEALGGLALVAWRQGRADEAIRLAETALETAPASPAPLVARARIHLEQGIPTQAERLLSRAAALRPSDALLWWELGNIRLELGDHRGAQAAFRRAGREWRGWGLAEIGEARSFTAAGKAVTAARQLEAYLARRKDRAPAERTWAHAALAEALLAQGRGFATSARAEAGRALELDPNHILARVVAAAASDALGDVTAAAQHHDRATAAAPHLPSVVLAHARHLRDTGAAPEAVQEVYRRYLDLAPRGPGAAEARRALRAAER